MCVCVCVCICCGGSGQRSCHCGTLIKNGSTSKIHSRLDIGLRKFFLFNLIDRLDEVSNVYASLFYF